MSVAKVSFDAVKTAWLSEIYFFFATSDLLWFANAGRNVTVQLY